MNGIILLPLVALAAFLALDAAACRWRWYR